MIMITIMINDHWQGRIQDMKLGMAQMDWKNWKPGDGGGRYVIYISNTNDALAYIDYT